MDTYKDRKRMRKMLKKLKIKKANINRMEEKNMYRPEVTKNSQQPKTINSINIQYI